MDLRSLLDSFHNFLVSAGKGDSHLGQVMLYAVGLTAAGLLRFKTRGARWGIAACLAIVWLWMAVNLYASTELRHSRPSALLFSGLALFQGFLILGAVGRGRLRFETGVSFWPIAGTVLLFYCLIVHPLLGILLGNAFADPFFGAPFPPVLFTLGLFFFLDRSSYRAGLALPLLWAAIGGPKPWGVNDPQAWILRAAFLAGAVFLLVPREVWGEEGHRLTGGEGYLGAYRHRTRLSTWLQGLILSTLLLTFVWWQTETLDIPWLPHMAISLGLLSVAGILLWLTFPAWLSHWFRPVAWWTARAGGIFWRWVRTNWKWGVPLLIAAVLAEWIGRSWLEVSKRPGVQDLRKRLDLIAGWELPLIAAVLLCCLIYAAYRARQRLVISAFANHTGESQGELKACVDGLAARLQDKLARIADLYRVIDEASPPQRGETIRPTVLVQDVGEILQEAAGGAGSSLKLWSLEIPTDFLLSLFGRLVKAPRIRGSVHKKGDQLILIAILSGGGRTGSWRVDSGKLAVQDQEGSEKDALLQMTDQLAFRVATSLVQVGSPSWRAVRCFTNGLRYYRKTQRTGSDQSLTLRKAEKAFIEALHEDNKFVQCHYNLGVVHQKLGEIASAESRFRRALQEDPDSYESCYALAGAYIDELRYEEALWFCDAAIRIRPSEAQTWDFKGYAQRQQVQKKLGVPSLPPDAKEWGPIIESREVGVALAWRALCRSMLSGPAALLQSKEKETVDGPSAVLHRQKETAFFCTLNLAVVRGRMINYDESERLFQQLVLLYPNHPELRYRLGRTLFWKGDGRSRVALEGLFDDGLGNLDRGVRWSTLTRAYIQSSHLNARLVELDARSSDLSAAQQSLARFLDVAAAGTGEDLERLIKELQAPDPKISAAPEARQ